LECPHNATKNALRNELNRCKSTASFKLANSTGEQPADTMVMT
jgi:hypothetical protein